MRGAFTGRRSRDKRGLFEEADGGTLFLDEIGETAAGAAGRSSCARSRAARCAASAATRDDASTCAWSRRPTATSSATVARGRFREDLFYRLQRVPDHGAAAARARARTSPLLAEHFLAGFAALRRGRRVGSRPPRVAALATHDWPGNVRELENTLERLVAEARGGTIDVPDLPPAFRERRAALEEPLFTGLPSLEELEKRYLRHVLAEVRGNRSRAAEVLGIDRRTLYRMAERFGIELGDDATPSRE